MALATPFVPEKSLAHWLDWQNVSVEIREPPRLTHRERVVIYLGHTLGYYKTSSMTIVWFAFLCNTETVILFLLYSSGRRL